MTPRDRELVRRLVDAARRREVELERALFGRTGCAECGADLDAVADGCRACKDRARRRWRRRHEPGFRERETATRGARRRRLVGEPA